MSQAVGAVGGKRQTDRILPNRTRSLAVSATLMGLFLGVAFATLYATSWGWALAWFGLALGALGNVFADWILLAQASD